MAVESESDKDTLEKKKLELEIVELGRPTWQRPAFVTPIIAAVLSIGLAYGSGWFDLQSTRLEIRRLNLEQDVKKFTKEKLAVTADVKKLRRQLAETKQKHKVASENLENVRRENERANRELAIVKVKYAKELESRRNERKKIDATIVKIKSKLETRLKSARGGTEIEVLNETLKKMENNLASSQIEERETIDRIRRIFGIPETNISDWEQKVKKGASRKRNA